MTTRLFRGDVDPVGEYEDGVVYAGQYTTRRRVGSVDPHGTVWAGDWPNASEVGRVDSEGVVWSGPPHAAEAVGRVLEDGEVIAGRWPNLSTVGRVDPADDLPGAGLLLLLLSDDSPGGGPLTRGLADALAKAAAGVAVDWLRSRRPDDPNAAPREPVHRLVDDLTPPPSADGAAHSIEARLARRPIAIGARLHPGEVSLILDRAGYRAFLSVDREGLDPPEAIDHRIAQRVGDNPRPAIAIVGGDREWVRRAIESIRLADAVLYSAPSDVLEELGIPEVTQGWTSETARERLLEVAADAVQRRWG